MDSDPQLSRIYADAPRPEPSDAIDDAILSAGRAAAQRDREQAAAQVEARTAWPRAARAALLVLAVGAVVVMVDPFKEETGVPQGEEAAPPPASAPGDTAEFAAPEAAPYPAGAAASAADESARAKAGASAPARQDAGQSSPGSTTDATRDEQPATGPENESRSSSGTPGTVAEPAPAVGASDDDLPPDVRERLDQIRQLISAGQFSDASAALAALRESHPEIPPGRLDAALRPGGR